jgi:hypothetical protein
LFKCDSSGNVQWKKKLITADHSPNAPGPIIQTKDEGYYFIYYGNGLSHLKKLNKNGNLIWSKAFNPSSSDYNYNIDKLAEATDGGTLLTVSNGGCEGYCVWYSLFKFQSNGNPSSVIYFNPDFYFGTTAYYLNEDSTGLIRIIAGGDILSLYNYGGYGYSYITIQPGATKAKVSVIKYDLFSLQHFLKNSKIAIANNKIYSNVNGLLSYFNFNDDWSLSVASDNNIRNGRQYLHVEHYDSNGRICPDFTTPIPDTNIIQKKAEIYRGTFSVIMPPAAIVTNSDLSSTMLQNYDSLLCSGVAPEDLQIKKNIAAVNASKQMSAISIYPNPAKTYIEFKLSTDKSRVTQIQLVSVDGKVIKAFSSFFAAGTTTKIYDISYLPKGIYLLKATTSTTQQTIKFIKE